MRPIATDQATTKYVGGPGVDDLMVEEGLEINPESGVVQKRLRSRWRPDDEERTALILGGDIVLDVMGSSLPPVRVLVSAPPVDATKVYATVDAVIATSQAVTIASLLADVAPELGVTIEVVRSWSDVDRKAVSEWLRAYGETPEGGTVPDWPTVLAPRDDTDPSYTDRVIDAAIEATEP